MPSKTNSLSAVKNGSSPQTGDDTILDPNKAKTSVLKVERINKGFQVEKSRAHKWDLLVAQMKAQGIKGPQLMDEAMDYLFKKYEAENQA